MNRRPGSGPGRAGEWGIIGDRRLRGMAAAPAATALVGAAAWLRRSLTMLEKFRETTGIYGLGFNKDSFFGLVLPIGFVLVVGGLGAALVLLASR